ncbi:MAG TPA: class I SAM-dependent methyltransferase [Paracoccus sp. (in: a-proteobacteria)]|uniref:class I SAM-dependent methyltransferase n=1 Tax=Paracoccus sp. TaxID=267 RepID=UPI002C911E06|nr:class I SAM-dependent methyltransferase [Paracoccus sp. (in: a-proteobacteria)]HWL58019.1 class I SAM-dependent methyltransferase [Paracoccus sp. (in: a-proteobacteria)]
MELQAVERSYARWAPIYDRTFGAVTQVGRRRATALLSELGGSVLEVGVGTGLALRHYDRRVTVTGVDYSAEMLEKARAKVAAEGLQNVAALHRMDARELDFADESFDHVAAMHVISVVPEPERVMSEIARVVRPGGSVVIVNHFARKTGALAMAERVAAPIADLLGWHSDFDRARVLGEACLTLTDECSLPPVGMMTLMRLVKAG